jgi:diaminopimelate epimerase
MEREGRALMHQPRFGKEGVNVNFVEPGLQSREISVRTYERGVEAETYSCGTGATAAAISAYYHHKSDHLTYTVKTVGGILNVTFESQHYHIFSSVYLTGPVSHVYDGEVEIRS